MPIQVKNRITALVVGPGLSRNETIHDQVKAILSNLNETDIPIIFDGVKFKNKLYFNIWLRMEFYYIKITFLHLQNGSQRSS